GPKGEYRFANLADVATGSFELYLQSFGSSAIVQTSPTYSLFAQDQFRATPGLTLNYGLRYDLQVLPQPKQCNPSIRAKALSRAKISWALSASNAQSQGFGSETRARADPRR